MIAHEGMGALIYLHQSSKGFNVDEGKRLAFHREARTSAPAHQRKTQREIGVAVAVDVASLHPRAEMRARRRTSERNGRIRQIRRSQRRAAPENVDRSRAGSSER